jgi:hypothetical protein
MKLAAEPHGQPYLAEMDIVAQMARVLVLEFLLFN